VAGHLNREGWQPATAMGLPRSNVRPNAVMIYLGVLKAGGGLPYR